MTPPDLLPRLEADHWKQRSLPGFMGTAGPLWTRREDDGWAYGVVCGAGHLNPAGVAHGGMLVTLLDHAISTVAWEACGRAACITLDLNTHFLAAVREGQFAEARAVVSHRTGGLIFMHGRVTVAGASMLTAQAILKVIARAGP